MVVTVKTTQIANGMLWFPTAVYCWIFVVAAVLLLTDIPDKVWQGLTRCLLPWQCCQAGGWLKQWCSSIVPNMISGWVTTSKTDGRSLVARHIRGSIGPPGRWSVLAYAFHPLHSLFFVFTFFQPTRYIWLAFAKCHCCLMTMFKTM